VKLGLELDAPELAPPLDMPELLLPEELGEELDELGVELDELPPLEAPDELLPDDPLDPVVALGEDLSLLDAPVDDEPELCAIETLASAKSAAAVAVVINFNFIWSSSFMGKKWGLRLRFPTCNTCA
jgi:hypothetical protein